MRSRNHMLWRLTSNKKRLYKTMGNSVFDCSAPADDRPSWCQATRAIQFARHTYGVICWRKAGMPIPKTSKPLQRHACKTSVE